MKKIFITFAILLMFSSLSCSVFETIVNVSRLKFKLGKVENFEVSGIPIAEKKKFNDFTSLELLKISSSVAQGELPVSFILNVEAKNPNDGTGGYPKTDIQIKSFPFKLYLNDKETIGGNIESPINVPGSGEIVNIPFKMSLDLFKFFKNKDYQSLINLALNIGGYGGSSSKLEVYAQPILTTKIGDISYPEEIKIVSYEFTKKQ